MREFIAFTLFLAFAQVIIGQDLEKLGIEDSVPPVGIEVGDVAPSFRAVDQNGVDFDLTTQLDDGPVVLIFYRGAWCPYCVKYLLNVSDSVKQIEDAGASIIAITPQLIEGIKTVANKTEGAIRILHDKGGAIMDAYDNDFYVTDGYQKRVNSKKLNLAESNGKEVAKLPLPATYVIDSDGKIIYRHFDYNYKKRATVKAILNALEE